MPRAKSRAPNIVIDVKRKESRPAQALAINLMIIQQSKAVTGDVEKKRLAKLRSRF